MSLTINVPEWSVWLVAGLLAVGAIVNVWHGIEMRRYRRAIKEDTAHD